MLGRKSISTSRGRTWEWLHSLWILWTFTLGFFSWLAFAYIGIRARRPRWTLWSLFYAAPLILFAVVTSNMSQWWIDVTLGVTVLLCPVAIVHAFLVRTEYLLRLDLIKRQTSSVSFTSRGRVWEWLHSLWMAWTLTLGIFGWVAFFYIAFRGRRVRWLMWGLAYFAAFVVFAVTAEGRVGQFTVGIMIVAGIASVVHAFAVREDYLVRLERRMNEASGGDARTLHPPGAGGERGSAVPPPVQGPEREMPDGSSSRTPADVTVGQAATETPAETVPETPPEPTIETAAGARSEAPKQAPTGAPKEPRP